MLDCLKKLISVGEKCGQVGNTPCAVFSFNDIAWFNEVKANEFVDSRYKNLSDFKEDMIRLSALELENEVTSYIGASMQLNDIVGIFNNFESSSLGCVKDLNAKGFKARNVNTCTAVKIKMPKLCIHTKNTTLGQNLTFYVRLDSSVIKPYTIELSGTGIDCLELCDDNGNELSAKKLIEVYSNDDTIEFVQHSIPCQTGCGNRIINDCAKIAGIYGSIENEQVTYGFEPVILCYCDYSDLICYGMSRNKMAELLLMKLENKIADYGVNSGRQSIFKQNKEEIFERLKNNAETYVGKFEAYVRPMMQELATKEEYNNCVNCTGITYGANR